MSPPSKEATPQQQPQNPGVEYPVRIPRASNDRRFSILKFSGSVDIQQFPTSRIRMQRQDNRAHTAGAPAVQQFGEGSEFGAAAREEARRKKFGRSSRQYELDRQPWNMQISDSKGFERRWSSIRETGAGEHADYWVFLKSGDEFHAHKVSDWYRFMPAITHRVLDEEQAEEHFKQRNLVMNQFALRAQLQGQMKAAEGAGGLDDDEGGGGSGALGKGMLGSGGGMRKSASSVAALRGLKIKDEVGSSSDDDDDDDGDDAGARKKKQNWNDEDDDDGRLGKKGAAAKKGKGKKKPTKQRDDKRQRVKEGDEIAAYESDDGDDEGREFDYMSDSGSDSDRDAEPLDAKIERQMVGVGDETGLKELIVSDNESGSGKEEDDNDEDDDDLDDDDDEEEGETIEEKRRKRRLLRGIGVKRARKLKTPSAVPPGSTAAILASKSGLLAGIEDKDSSDDAAGGSDDSDAEDPDQQKLDSFVFMTKPIAPAQLASSASNGGGFESSAMATSSSSPSLSGGAVDSLPVDASNANAAGGPSGEGAANGQAQASQRKRPADVVAGLEAKRIRQQGPGEIVKVPTTVAHSPMVPEGLNEETVKKYLRRKPHTTKELLNKMKSKCGDMPKQEMLSKLADILKAINPIQTKQKQGKKDVLYFSLVNRI